MDRGAWQATVQGVVVKVVPSKCHFKEKKIRKRIRRKSQILDVYTIKSQNIGGKMKKMAS